MTKKQIKQNRDKVSALYKQVGNGIQVPIMSLGSIMDAGLRSLDAGGSDDEIKAALTEQINKVRVG